mmetsp:Transcript_88452/g.245624  ORF Transcript_88452/g.245624 Transcript_88452/m.245624 type:complete len:222 (+) Transcript_88452:443-1108(+)
MSILSGFLSGCHSRRSRRNSLARCSLGSTFFSTVSFANTCFLACAISGGSLTGAACVTTTAAPPPGAVGPWPDFGGGSGARGGGELRKRLVRLARLLRLRLPLEEELLEELDFERLRDFLDLLLLERLLELLLERLAFFFDRPSAPSLEDHRDLSGEENRLERCRRLLFDRRRLLALLFELRFEDLFAERLGVCDFSDSDSSESRNFFGAAAPRQRRSFLP